MRSIQEYLRQPSLARYPFVFIITYGRSGSTLLMGLLNSLDGYHIRGENYHALLFIFRAIERLRLARCQWAEENSPEHPWYGAHLIDPDLFERACTDAFFRAVLRPPSGARCCGFKEIRYTNAQIPDDEFPKFLDFLSRAFPGSAFIFNFRDMEATARSGWWTDYSRRGVIRRLNNAQQRMRSYAEAKPERTFCFSYDRLLSDALHFAELCEFLGEHFDAAQVKLVMSRQHSYVPDPQMPLRSRLLKRLQSLRVADYTGLGEGDVRGRRE
jgi:LPS sulfotransferase NodH